MILGEKHGLCDETMSQRHFFSYFFFTYQFESPLKELSKDLKESDSYTLSQQLHYKHTSFLNFVSIHVTVTQFNTQK